MEIFKIVVGTDKGMEKFQRGIEDVRVIKLGWITSTLKEELKYDLLKINDDYTHEKLGERKLERRV